MASKNSMQKKRLPGDIMRLVDKHDNFLFDSAGAFRNLIVANQEIFGSRSSWNIEEFLKLVSEPSVYLPSGMKRPDLDTAIQALEFDYITDPDVLHGLSEKELGRTLASPESPWTVLTRPRPTSVLEDKIPAAWIPKHDFNLEFLQFKGYEENSGLGTGRKRAREFLHEYHSLLLEAELHSGTSPEISKAIELSEAFAGFRDAKGVGSHIKDIESFVKEQRERYGLNPEATTITNRLRYREELTEIEDIGDAARVARLLDISGEYQRWTIEGAVESAYKIRDGKKYQNVIDDRFKIVDAIESRWGANPEVEAVLYRAKFAEGEKSDAKDHERDHESYRSFNLELFKKRTDLDFLAGINGAEVPDGLPAERLQQLMRDDPRWFKTNEGSEETTYRLHEVFDCLAEVAPVLAERYFKVVMDHFDNDDSINKYFEKRYPTLVTAVASTTPSVEEPPITPPAVEPPVAPPVVEEPPITPPAVEEVPTPPTETLEEVVEEGPKLATPEQIKDLNTRTQTLTGILTNLDTEFMVNEDYRAHREYTELIAAETAELTASPNPTAEAVQANERAIVDQINTFRQFIQEQRFNQPEDKERTAIITLQAEGESKYVEKLIGMYKKFAEDVMGWRFEEISRDEHKGAKIKISGKNAEDHVYGWLRPDQGIHRFVYFDRKQHADLVHVYVSPEIDHPKFTLREGEFQYQESSGTGPGGAHRNRSSVSKVTAIYVLDKDEHELTEDERITASAEGRSPKQIKRNARNELEKRVQGRLDELRESGFHNTDRDVRKRSYFETNPERTVADYTSENGTVVNVNIRNLNSLEKGEILPFLQAGRNLGYGWYRPV